MTVSPGQSFPLAATVVDGDVNFCVLSREASRLELPLLLVKIIYDGQRQGSILLRAGITSSCS